MQIKEDKKCISKKLEGMGANGNFLGLDLSLSSTGAVMLSSDGFITSYNVRSDNKKDGNHTVRIAGIRDILFSALDQLTSIEEKPSVVAVEGYAMGIRGGMSFTLGELGGSIKEALRVRGHKVLLVPPSVLKKFIGASGTGKELVRLEVYKKYGIEFVTSDETDAFVLSVIAMTYHLNLHSTYSIPKYMLECLEKCELLDFS